MIPSMEKNNTEPTEAKVTPTPVPPAPVAPGAATAHRAKRRRSSMVLLLLILALLGVGVAWENDFWRVDTREITSRPTVQDDGNNKTTQQEADIASLVSNVSPSVVSITTQSQAQTFFGVAEREGAGTGIIVSSDGYIMTNKHVVSGATTVGVVLTDGTAFEDVRVIGSDPLNDVAFLKIPDVNNLTPAELGNSSSVRVGQQVVAIGNSLGQYQNTVTSGIISGTGRPVSAQSGNTVESLTDLLQTDAAINPGNSGGPLLNMSGQVIGMNTAVATNAQGIGFAIPINGVRGMIKGVLESGKVARAFLGVGYVPITPATAEFYDLPVKSGAYVYRENGASVSSNSPAEEAGIKDKDIITKINDVEIGKNGALATLVGEYAPGDTITITLLRGGKEQTVKVTLDAYNT